MNNSNMFMEDWQPLFNTEKGVCLVRYTQNEINFTMPCEDYREGILRIWEELFRRGIDAQLVVWQASEVLVYGTCKDFYVV